LDDIQLTVAAELQFIPILEPTGESGDCSSTHECFEFVTATLHRCNVNQGMTSFAGKFYRKYDAILKTVLSGYFSRN